MVGGMRWLGAVGVTCGLVALGCGSDGDGEAKPAVTIGWLAKGSGNNFFDLSRRAADLAAADLSSASGREVTVVHLDSEETTPEAQAERVDAAIELGVDALAISSLNPEIVGPAIDRAVAAGIPVITFDSDAPATQRSTFYGIDNLQGAITAAELLGELMGGEGKVAIMTAGGSEPGTLSTSQTYLERMGGFLDTLAADYPNLEVVATTTCVKADETDRNGCADILEEVMAEHPDVTGWYLARGRVFREANLDTLAPNWAAGVLAGDIHVVGFDVPEDALPALQKGLSDAVITQDFFGWGYDVVTMAFDIVTQGRTFDAFTDSQFDVICANNIEQLASMWVAQDFRDQLVACNLTGAPSR